jgi:putative methyltransferase (TIGR04325 family)
MTASGILREIPVVRAVMKARFERSFVTARGFGCLSGSYPTFAAAAAAAPPRMAVGYDVTAAGAMYRERMNRVLLKDYPALLWLSRLMPKAHRLFDIGGHVGIMFYAYRRYLNFRDDLEWTVCDVPAVVKEGEAMARARDESNLSFTTRLDDVDGSDVVLATGSLQYIERSIGDLLGSLVTRPEHVLINETPTHPERDIITLQNIGVSICPYRIVRHGSILTAMTTLGYELVDSWEDPVRRTGIPFVTDGAEIAYSGFYFRRAAP